MQSKLGDDRLPMENVLPYASPTTPEKSSPLPGAWISLSLLLAINLLNYIDRQVLAAVEPRIREAFHVSKATSGWLGTAFILSYMLTAPLFGWLSDRKSRWAIVGFGVLLWSLATAASGWAGTFVFLLISRLFVGVGEAGYGPSAPTIISDLFPIRWRGSVISWFYVAMPVGAAIGYIIGDKLGGDPHWGWRTAFYAVTIPGLLLGIICFFFKDPPRGTADVGHAVHGLPRWGDYMQILRIRSWVTNTLAMAAMSFAIGGMSFWMPDYLEVYRKLGGGSGSTFGIIIASAGLTATVLGGLAGDLVRKVYGGSYFLVSGIGIMIAGPMVIGMLYVPFPFAWWFLFGAIFFLFFNTGPANTALANVVHPKVRASAFAINIFLIHALGDAPAPPIIGHIVDRYGWNPAFFLVAGCMMLAGLLWLIGAPHLKSDEDAVTHEKAVGAFEAILPHAR
jgi:MFS family permease